MTECDRGEGGCQIKRDVTLERLSTIYFRITNKDVLLAITYNEFSYKLFQKKSMTSHLGGYLGCDEV